jgi:hypothetical protein
MTVLCRSKYLIGIELSFRNSRCDLAVNYSNLGDIFEKKFNKNSDVVLKQIVKKRYYDVFKRKSSFANITDFVYTGLNVNHNLNVNLINHCNTSTL